jgi:hemerythrin-like domain-containing protein
MKSVDILIREHGLIRQALDTLSLAKETLEKGQRPPRTFFEKAVEFSKSFSDRFHHFKEEFLMFGLLSQIKEGRYDSEIGVLKYQHERGRKFIDQIEQSIEGYADGDLFATTTLLENLASYISLLKLHIHCEDHIFFQMVKKALSAEEDQALLTQFKNEEKRFGSKNFFEKSRKLVLEMEALIEQWQQRE